MRMIIKRTRRATSESSFKEASKLLSAALSTPIALFSSIEVEPSAMMTQGVRWLVLSLKAVSMILAMEYLDCVVKLVPSGTNATREMSYSITQPERLLEVGTAVATRCWLQATWS